MATRVQMESALRVSDCVTELLRTQPFFGSLALRLPLRPDRTRETLACDGHEIRYSPQWIADTDAHFIGTAIARVMLACGLKHHTRRGERDPERWQLASQLVTHAILRDAGFPLPPGADAWDGMTVEEAYDRLPDPDENGDGDAPDSAATPAGAGLGDASAGAPGEGDDADSDATPDPGDDARDGSNDEGDETDRGDPQERSGDGPDSDAPASHDPSGTGEIMDADERSDPNGGAGEAPLDVIGEEQSWDKAMHQALNLAKSEGKLPGRLEEMVHHAHTTMLDWRTLLRRYMTDAARRDYSWAVPNRRFIDSGLYLPSIHSEGIDTIAVIIDTSGSLCTETLADFWAEVREIATEIQPETVVVLQVDAAVQDAAEYSGFDLPEEIIVTGRGGTDFRPGFAWLDDHATNPGVCLYLTDMICSDYPETPPAYDVVWVNWGDPPADWNREPWGERIDIAA